jgi:hypothetical protein
MDLLLRAALGVAQEMTAALNGYQVTHSDNCP